MFLRSIRYMCAGIVLVMGAVFGEEFSDDFSAGTSNTHWVKSSDSVSIQFVNGGCSLTNKDATYTGFALHTLTSKPSTFTLSGKITLASGTEQAAGFVCCLASSGMATGYYVSIVRNEGISVNKMGTSGTSSNLVNKSSAYLTNGTNELKISKKESTFNVFCNGKFVATFTDSDQPSGNIALLVSPKTTAVFDDIVLTETFEEGSLPTCFGDNFDDGDLIGWTHFGSENVVVQNVDGAMRIATATGQNIYQLIDLPLENFVLRTVVSHRGGSTVNMYGLFLCGAGESTIPIAGFGIDGGKNYAVFTAGQNIQLIQSSKVKGAAYVSGTDTTFYYDTLEVIKRTGSQEYLFVINTDTLSRFTGVNFAITGAGIFCLDSIIITADNFVVAEGTNAICPIKNVIRKRTGTCSPVISEVNEGEFDILGRITSRSMTTTQNRRQAPGMYLVRKNGTAMLRIATR
jgi:hypothetical protein